MWLTAKVLAIFFGLAATAFCVATIVLAVEKADLEDELQGALDKLDMISATTTTTTRSTPTSTTTNPGNPTGPTSATNPTGPSSPTSTTKFPWWPTITVTQEAPDAPTLPTGLPDPEKIRYRLPTDLRPIKYLVYWHPDLKTRTFDGTVSVQVEVDVETNLIVMHAKNLEIDGISILNMMARMRIRVSRYWLIDELEILIIELEEVLRMATPYTVSIGFRGSLEGLAGMYASSYLGEQGEDR